MARRLVGVSRTRHRWAALALALVVLLAGCGTRGDDPEPDRDWPAPDPGRPVVELTFDVADDLRSAVGRETVAFATDTRICELVFRAWPNKPVTARAGNSLTITGAWVDDAAVEPVVESAGAPGQHPGTLIRLPLAGCASPGQIVEAELTFEVALGEGTDERVGVSERGDIAWFGSAFPLLAWVRDQGWATDPAEYVAGEMATSETFDLRSLEVEAPAGMAVLGAGAPDGAEEAAVQGRVVHRFSAPAVRDVTVTVGALDVLEHEADGWRLFLGTPRHGTRAPAQQWAEEIEAAVSRLSERLGPMPYEEVWVSVLPDQTDGIEFPGAVQFGDVALPESTWLITHEMAHMWFYGLVGNNQARHPWLDEALASFAQHVADGWTDTEGVSRTAEVGRSMAYWADQRWASHAYVEEVYGTGAEALLLARFRSGPEQFDAALRDYLAVNAHRVAEPADLRAALADMPQAVAVLRRAGAFAAEA